MTCLIVHAGGNVERPVHHHKPRKTGRIQGIEDLHNGARVVWVRRPAFNPGSAA